MKKNIFSSKMVNEIKKKQNLIKLKTGFLISNQVFRINNKKLKKKFELHSNARLLKSRYNKLYREYMHKDFGVEKFCIKHLVGKAGYNPRVAIFFIRKKSMKKLIKKLYPFLDKKSLYKSDLDISKLKEIQCRRGIRHNKYLPTRGQRTKTNGHTMKKLNPKYISKKKVRKKNI